MAGLLGDENSLRGACGAKTARHGVMRGKEVVRVGVSCGWWPVRADRVPTAITTRGIEAEEQQQERTWHVMLVGRSVGRSVAAGRRPVTCVDDELL